MPHFGTLADLATRLRAATPETALATVTAAAVELIDTASAAAVEVDQGERVVRLAETGGPVEPHSILTVAIPAVGQSESPRLVVLSDEPDAFDSAAEATAVLVAAHAGLALAASSSQDRIANLERALLSNRHIGVAVGILMSRRLITSERAFDLLRNVSQRTHRKLSAIALEVAEQGDLNDQPGPDSAPITG